MTSAVLILPAALKGAGNALSIALGDDVQPGFTYGRALAASPEGEATHYGTHAWVTQQFIDIVQAAAQGHVPEGLDGEQVATVLGSLIASFNDSYDTPRDHWLAILAANTLVEKHEDV